MPATSDGQDPDHARTTGLRALSAAAPDLHLALLRAIAAHRHHIVATLRSDGSPRLSGTEVAIDGDDLWIGIMQNARKDADLRRDPRVALHTTPLDTDLTDGDVKVDAIAVEITDPDRTRRLLTPTASPDTAPADETVSAPLEGTVWALHPTRVTRTRVRGEELVIDWWTPASGLRRIARR